MVITPITPPLTDANTGLMLGITLCKSSEELVLEQRDVLPGANYEGWVFTTKEQRLLAYDNGLLIGHDLKVPLSRLSIGELIEWDILQPIAGHTSDLCLRPCPECTTLSYFAGDYLCHQCRKDHDDKYTSIA